MPGAGLNEVTQMKEVYVSTIKEAKRLLPMLEIIRVSLALQNGHTVHITDERKGVVYVFKPKMIKEETSPLPL